MEEVAINSCQMVLEDEIYQAENNGHCLSLMTCSG